MKSIEMVVSHWHRYAGLFVRPISHVEHIPISMNDIKPSHESTLQCVSWNHSFNKVDRGITYPRRAATILITLGTLLPYYQQWRSSKSTNNILTCHDKAAEKYRVSNRTLTSIYVLFNLQVVMNTLLLNTHWLLYI